MPIIKSAKKRVRTGSKAAARNSKTKRSLKSALKSFSAKITSSSHNKAQSALDKSAKKGLVHKNKVARTKRRLAASAKKAGVKPAASTKKPVRQAQGKPVAKKPAVKKAAPKKAAAKKPVKKTTKKK